MKNLNKIGEIVRDLLNNSHSTESIIDDLVLLIIDEPIQNEDKHFDSKWLYINLKDFFIELKESKPLVDIYSIIDSWFSIHPEEGIDNKLSTLHDLMINWLDIDDLHNETTRKSVFKSYRTLRTFFLKLKPIELEYIQERK